MRRPRTANDRLPAALTPRISESGALLRLEAARKISPGFPVWLIPGPQLTCVGRIVRSDRGKDFPAMTDCQSTKTIARRGLFTAATCSNRTPRRITLVGAVPAGTDRVKLLPKCAPARTVGIRGDGTWIARTPYPLEVAWAVTRLTPTFNMRACWY